MYIIVVGGGQVGFHLSKELISEGHEVLLSFLIFSCENLYES